MSDLEFQFFREGLPGAFLLPKFHILVMELQQAVLGMTDVRRRTHAFLASNGEYECVSVDGSYKPCMSLIDQVKHGARIESCDDAERRSK